MALDTKESLCLTHREVALIKAMLKYTRFNMKKIMSYFSSNLNKINESQIYDISTNKDYTDIDPVNEDTLDIFLSRHQMQSVQENTAN